MIQIKQETDGIPDGSQLPHQTSQPSNDTITIKTEPPDDLDYIDVPFAGGSESNRETTRSETPVTRDLSTGLEGYLLDSNSGKSTVDVPFSMGLSVPGSDNVYYSICNEVSQVQTLDGSQTVHKSKKKKSKSKHKKKSKSDGKKEKKVKTKNTGTQTMSLHEQQTSKVSVILLILFILEGTKYYMYS